MLPEGSVPAAHGGATVARVDHRNLVAAENTGKSAINLAALDEDLTSARPHNRLDRDQLHARDRQDEDEERDRRATTNTME